MMLPNQITLQTFSQTGKGGYKAIEVDAFIQRVYQSYNKLYTDNKALCEKLDETLPLLEEYNKRKNSIADALIWAKSTAEKNIEEAQAIADKLVFEATEKADKLLDEKRAEADAYYSEKTTVADERVKKAQAEFESLKQQSETFSDKYISDVNAKVQTIIEDANVKAASIVADAYADAKKAKEKADVIIADANKELNSLKAEAAKIKNEILSLISYAQQAADAVGNHIFEPLETTEDDETEFITAEELDIEEFEKFTLDDIRFAAEEDSVENETAEEKAAQPEFVRFFDTKLPDVDKLFTGIFTSASESNTKKVNKEDENSFKFTDIFADPADRGNTKVFNALTKDSE